MWEVDDLPESELEQWRGYLMYKGECCSSCGIHPANFMKYDMGERICPVCRAESNQVVPWRQPIED